VAHIQEARMTARDVFWMTGNAICCVVLHTVAADGSWTNRVGGKWNEPGNWLGGVVAEGEGNTAFFTNAPSAKCLVRVPSAGVTLQNLLFSGFSNAFYLFDGFVTLEGGNPQVGVTNPNDSNNANNYNTDLRGTNGVSFYGGTLGMDTSYTGPTRLCGKNKTLNTFMHFYVAERGVAPSNFLSGGTLIFDGGHLRLEGCKAKAGGTGVFTLTEGDTLIHWKSGTTPWAGFPVSGNGVPDGAFCRQQIHDQAYILSHPATASGDFSLSIVRNSGSLAYQWFDQIDMQAYGILTIVVSGYETQIETDTIAGRERFFRIIGSGNNSTNLAIFRMRGANGFPGAIEASAVKVEALAQTNGVNPEIPDLTVAATTILTVPEPEAVLSVPGVTLIEGELAKEGAGTLALQHVYGADPRVCVRGGTLALAAPVVPEPAPVGGAWFHADASATASLVTEQENGTNFVVCWRDVRGNGIYATNDVANSGPRPFLRSACQNGLPVVDFGSYHYPAKGVVGYGAYLNWSEMWTKIYECYFVYSDTEDTASLSAGTYWPTPVGNSNHNAFFARGVNGAILGGPLAQEEVLSGVISLDHATVPAATVVPSGFHVVSFVATNDVRAGAFARERVNSYGGVRIAEVLVFTNRLTVAARREITDYLSRKWFGREPGIGALTLDNGSAVRVADGETVRVGALCVGKPAVKTGGGVLSAETVSGDSLVISNGTVRQTGAAGLLSGGVSCVGSATLDVADEAGSVTAGWIDAEGELSKAGEGELTVATLGVGVTSLHVRGGALNVTGVDPAYGQDAVFHVDADDAASLETVAVNGTNFVTRWNDCRTNGFYAAAQDTVHRPFLSPGQQNGRNVVDFGAFTKDTNAVYTAWLNWKEYKHSVRDVFVVVRDTDPSKQATLVGNQNHYLDFMRGASGALVGEHPHSEPIRNGSCAIDGTSVTYTARLPDGFHVVSFFPTNTVRASAFGRERFNGFGGHQLAEALFFTRELSANERQNIHAQLLSKWLGQTLHRAFDHILVENGGVCSITNMTLATDLLEGTGTIRAQGLTADALSAGTTETAIGSLAVSGGLTLPDGAVVDVDCNAFACDRVDVQGTLTIGGGGTVRLRGDGGDIGEKVFTLFSFDTCAGGENLTLWQVTGEITARYVVRLWIEDNQVRLGVKGKGTQVLLR